MYKMGPNIKAVRQALGLSQEQLGQFFDSGRAYISLIENDKSRLSLDNLVKFALNKNINIYFLLTGKPPMFLNICENTHTFIKNDNPQKNIKDWGKRLSQLLAENKETSYAFSKRTNIKESRIEKFILNSEMPTIEELTKIKCNVDISIDELLYGETVEKNTQTEQVSLSTSEILALKQLLNNQS